MDLDVYRSSAEAFHSALNAAYYRHFAGLEADYEIEPIYARHAELFTGEAVSGLREQWDASRPGTDEHRRRRLLLEFAVEGYTGEATKAAEAELARVEAELSVELDGEAIGLRESSVRLANEPDPSRRAQLERARLELSEQALQPLHLELTERAHACAGELGWPSYLAMCQELGAVDLEALAAQTGAFLAATEPTYASLVEPELRRTLGLGLERMGRSDLPRFFRAPEQDDRFPAERLLPSFLETMADLGIDVRAQPGVVLDVESRPNKSPRAFCAPVRSPGEVYLMLTPVGGRDDFGVLLHEGGHTEHCAHMDPALAFEFRCLGDNAITECFAFLFQHLIDDPRWLRDRLGVTDPEPLVAYGRAQRMIYLRRYAAKLAYELELHGTGQPPGPALAARYGELLGGALRIDWPAQTFLSDVDPMFYCASYLRAWALEHGLRAYLESHYGERWFAQRAAGDELRALWRDGQRASPEELLDRLCGRPLDFTAVLADVGQTTGGAGPSASSAHTR